MRPRLTGREHDDVALLELAPSLRCAQARPAFEDDEDLLLGQVRVVGVRRLAWVDFPVREPGLQGALQVADLPAARFESGLVTRIVELGAVDVRHAAILRGRPLASVPMSTDATDIDIGSLRDQLKLLADYL